MFFEIKQFIQINKILLNVYQGQSATNLQSFIFGPSKLLQIVIQHDWQLFCEFLQKE